MPSAKKVRKPVGKPAGKGPSEISPGVFVGGWKDALKFEGARFCVLDEAPDDMPPATHIAIYNEEKDRASVADLDRLASAIELERAAGRPVLVFCGHGVRRSPLGAAWYLRRSAGLSLDDAFDRIRAVRPKIEPPSAWVGNAGELERA